MQKSNGWEVKETERYGEVESKAVDLSKQPVVICGENPEDHDFVINAPKREVTCERCGYGFLFKVKDMEYRNGELFLRLPDATLKRVA